MAKKPNMEMGKPMEDVYSDEDIMDFIDDYEEQDVMTDLMTSLSETSNQQMYAAVELTKLIHGNSEQARDVDSVLATYRKVMATLSETSPLQKLLEQIQPNH